MAISEEVNFFKDIERKSEVEVSVIIPCFNQAHFLPEALASVFEQTLESWECIIVNDGSTDETEEVAKRWCEKDDRFVYVEKVNGGLSSARNYGIKKALGKYILPLDADDIIHRDYLKSAILHFEKKPETKLVYCQAQKFGLVSGKWPLKPYNYKTLLIQNIIFCSAIYKKSDFFAFTSGYDEKMLNGYEDWDFWLQLIGKDDIVYQMTEEFFYYRIKEKSTIFTNEYFETEKRKYIFKKHIQVYLDNLPDPIFLAQQNEIMETVYKNSYAYKLGSLILAPLKKTLSVFGLNHT